MQHFITFWTNILTEFKKGRFSVFVSMISGINEVQNNKIK